MNESADFVMYWWDRAAELLTRKGTRLHRFGLVTTNSLSQVFQRRVVERHLQGEAADLARDGDSRSSLDEGDARRRGGAHRDDGRGGRSHEGRLLEVTKEEALDTDEPQIAMRETDGVINSDLTVGVDVTKVVALKANAFVCSPGVKLHGDGFIVTPAEAEHLGLGKRLGLEAHIRAYRNGRDLTARPRGVMVIDLYGVLIDDVRRRFPEVYQHLLATVKPERDLNNEAYRRTNWWLFGRKNTLMRGFTADLPRYIATPETSKHRVFQFLDRSILPDNMLVCAGLR